MFCHIKDLQFDARVSEPDPRFASILLEQFGGANGELKACMQYFVQAFGCRYAFPEKYDMLMDIASEEMSHLEVVGSLITMLLDGVNGELKDAANAVEWNKIMSGGKEQKEDFIHEAVMNPQFLALTGGGPRLTDSQGTPWSGSYVNANGDLSVDLRSDIAAESRAKIVYEYLMQFTDDPDVKDTLGFLMTREVSHMNMFRAALDTVDENFPPGVLKEDPRYSHKYFNMSDGEDVRGPWNDGQGPWEQGEEWDYIDDPVEQVTRTKGQRKTDTKGSKKSVDDVTDENKNLSKKKSDQIKQSMPKNGKGWSDYKRRSQGPTQSTVTRSESSDDESQQRPS
ncbi:MAG: manganese catalase family protein [Persicimonas sp.]